MIKAIRYVISVVIVEGSTREIGKVPRMEAIKAILPIFDLAVLAAFMSLWVSDFVTGSPKFLIPTNLAMTYLPSSRYYGG